jgi:hypothetical protein
MNDPNGRGSTAPRGYPAAYVADPRRPDVFDPALKHLDRAFVKGEPETAEDAGRLAAARSTLLQRALRALATPSLRDRFALRGSLTLESWFPDRARRARDIDLVVRDASLSPEDPRAASLLAELARAVEGALAEAEVGLGRQETTVDRIWTYERAEGRRLSVPWLFAGSTRDVIQIDLVFREPLQDALTLEPVHVENVGCGYREAARADTCLWFASRAESLAWKLLWLETDMWPQGKDLYDAALLAEGLPLSVELLRRVYAGKGTSWQHGRDPGFVHTWRVDWEAFAKEYPALAVGGADACLERLASTLTLQG